VEITHPIAVVESLLLTAMLTLFTSPINPMLAASFLMGEARSMDKKNKSMRPTKITSTIAASVQTLMQLPPVSTTHLNRALPITIML
jgi:hypothetical protein